MEAFVCHTPNRLTDPLCRDALERGGRALRRAFDAGDDLEARQEMCFVSLVGGLALANARLGAVHGFAAPLGGMFAAPHGALCAALLAPVMKVNMAAMRRSRSDHPSLARYTEVARRLTGRADVQPEDGTMWVEALCRHMRIPSLRSFGVTEADFPAIAQKAAAASSMKGNPVALSDADREQILRLAI